MKQGCPLSPLIFALVMEPLAEKIGSHKVVKGIAAGGEPHTIPLFADDIILTLDDPLHSLPVVHQILNNFNLVSFYKVNETKSNILGININNTMKQKLQSQFSYPWSSNTLSYLGITLTSPMSNLYKENYAPLLSETQKETNKIGKLYLSWAGRLTAFKMSILPKNLYTFRTLPIQIPPTFFKAMQKIISTLLWSKSKSRCTHDILRKHKKAGGMGVPDIHDYYIATLLDQLRFWFIQPNLKPWSSLQQNTVQLGNLQSLLMANTLSPKIKIGLDHPTISASILAWKRFLLYGNSSAKQTKVPITIGNV